MVLTSSRGNMSNVVLGTFSSHFVFEVLGKISGAMPLEQIVEQDGIVCSVCVRHKTKLSDTTQEYSPDMSLLSCVVIDSLEWSSSRLGWDDH